MKVTPRRTDMPALVKRGEVRQVRELKRGVQAHVCLGSSVVHGSATVVLETASPKVLKALEALKTALREDALALYRDIQADDLEATG